MAPPAAILLGKDCSEYSSILTVQLAVGSMLVTSSELLMKKGRIIAFLPGPWDGSASARGFGMDVGGDRHLCLSFFSWIHVLRLCRWESPMH